VAPAWRRATSPPRPWSPCSTASFRALSYADVGSAALLSRALAGLAAGRVVFVLPGSRGAVKLAMEKLVLPEIGHLAAEAVKTR
jgi:molybdenum cofactor biosynthesis protein B